MTPLWTVFACEQLCGHGSGAHPIRAGEPVYVKAAAIYRCEAHAAVHVDVDQVIAAELALQRERAPLVDATAPPRTQFDIAKMRADVRRRIGQPHMIPRPTVRVTPKPKKPIPFPELQQQIAAERRARRARARRRSA